jgi:hypothetical protein
MNKIRGLAQVVGFVTLGLLAIYGLLTLLGGTGAFGLAARVDAETLNTSGQAAALMDGTIPQTMNYQGLLRQADGELAEGFYTITARIWNSATLGTKLYETTVPNVNVRDGLFNIVLGDDPALPPEAFADVPRYIGIDLNDGGDELMPRQRLHAVPWALTSSTLVDDATVNGVSVTGNLDVLGKVRGVTRTLQFHYRHKLNAAFADDNGKYCHFTKGFDTDLELYEASEWVCGLVGFSVGSGNINETTNSFQATAEMRIEEPPGETPYWAPWVILRCDDSLGDVYASYWCIPRSLVDFTDHMP